MPKIDWAPGLGRHSRPLRRVLGMGQKQGLIVLYGIAGVMVLVAAIAALGGFSDDPPRAVPGTAAGSGGVGTDPDAPGAPAVDAKGSAAASRILLDSVQHYSDLFAAGQKIVGNTRYPDPAAYSKAYMDPQSPAAAFAKYRIASRPESDTTYVEAMDKASAAYGGRAKVLNRWLDDMATAKSDLGDWVATAARFQHGAAGQTDLDAAAAKVTQDLATAKNDAGALSG